MTHFDQIWLFFLYRKFSHLVKSSNYEAPHHAVFSSLLLFLLFRYKYSLKHSAHKQSHSLCGPSLTWEAKFPDCLCGLVIRVSWFDSHCYQIIWDVVSLERGPLSLVSTTELLLEINSSGSGLENPRILLCGGSSVVSIVHYQTKAKELYLHRGFTALQYMWLSQNVFSFKMCIDT
jgi:hypothetical protein